MIKVCLAGALGRMGSSIISESKNFPEISIVSGFISHDDKTDILDIPLFNKPNEIKKACKGVDIWLDFTTPSAIISNLPLVAQQKVDVIIGTTGWYEKLEHIKNIVKEHDISAIISPNFSPLVNLQFKLTEISTQMSRFGYTFGIVEEHHEKKIDVPSGTAKMLADIVMKHTNYKVKMFRREGNYEKNPNELDVASLRLKGTVGDHEVRIRGGNGRMNINTMIYSRNEFANGALYAVEWLYKNKKSGKVFEFYKDVLGF